MKIDKELKIEDLIEDINKGKKEFIRIEIGSGKLTKRDLEGITFNECILMVDFTGSNLSNSCFTNSNLKTCNFMNANLSNAILKNNMLCSSCFTGAQIEGITFIGNYYHSKEMTIEDLNKMVRQ
jgi:uncharacterized protein YjbI with pentapeptide repeats